MKLSNWLFALTIPFSSLSFAQQCNDNTYNPIADDQYLDLENGTIVDRSSALMWQSCSAGQSYQGSDCLGDAFELNWLEAFEYAQNSVQAGHTDWRLPNIKELTSLESLNCVDPVIHIEVFPNTISGNYWSSTIQVNSDQIWIIDFGNANKYAVGKTEQLSVRLVRDL